MSDCLHPLVRRYTSIAGTHNCGACFKVLAERKTEMIEFRSFPKIARLNRDIIITEKIDGTNAAIGILSAEQQADLGIWTPGADAEPAPRVYAQSRKRIITPEDDNFGFAKWVANNAVFLADTLGPGLHFGEWWGEGIQRGYGLKGKRFSLFNVAKWGSYTWPDGENMSVPVLYKGPMSTVATENALDILRIDGSHAALGYLNPEGIVIFHTASRTMFKVTLEGDEKPKGSKE